MICGIYFSSSYKMYVYGHFFKQELRIFTCINHTMAIMVLRTSRELVPAEMLLQVLKLSLVRKVPFVILLLHWRWPHRHPTRQPLVTVCLRSLNTPKKSLPLFAGVDGALAAV
jgi:hypothetical protein